VSLVVVDGCEFSAHGFSLKIDSVSVVDKSVEDGVCECGLANGFMPACDRQLTGDNRGVVAVPVVEYFEQFAPRRGSTGPHLRGFTDVGSQL